MIVWNPFLWFYFPFSLAISDTQRVALLEYVCTQPNQVTTNSNTTLSSRPTTQIFASDQYDGSVALTRKSESRMKAPQAAMSRTSSQVRFYGGKTALSTTSHCRAWFRRRQVPTCPDTLYTYRTCTSLALHAWLCSTTMDVCLCLPSRCWDEHLFSPAVGPLE